MSNANPIYGGAIAYAQRMRSRSAVTGMVVVSSALVLVALPFFMVGGLAVQIKDELDLTEASFGAAVTIGFIVGAACAPFGGRLADRIGPRRSTYFGSALCVASLAGLGAVTTNWSTLAGFLCLAGVSIALTDPGLAILVGRAIPHERQGLAFGVKEASIPASTLVAGLAVPAVALTVGWRWAFLIGVLPLGLVLWLLPRLDTSPGPTQSVIGDSAATGSPPKRRALLIAATAAALGTTAASGVGIFLTDSAVSMGMTPANAGLLLAAGSLAGIAARIAAGYLADRTGGPQFRLISVMLAIGAVTMLLGGTGNTLLLILGTLGAFTGGWAWTGIYFLSLVKSHPERPGAVAGIGTAGLGMGNAAGPVLFGFVAATWSFGASWVWAALVAGAAALLMAVARRMF